MSSSPWHRLHLSQKDLPLLLFQYTWTQKGYEICVTDLSTIWFEKLSHAQIVRRAEENATTIDAGESPDQFEVLLTKIGEALQGAEGSASLCRGSPADALDLHTSTKLPPPLKPLKWSFNLAKEASSSLTDRILLPLLKDEARWEKDQRSLLDQIKQKDWILGKLFDKLEAVGVELGTVFPSAAGFRTSRKGSSRSEAARFVKGIAPFDEQAWLAESEKASAGTSGLAANIVHETAAADGGLDLRRLHAPQDQWWNALERYHVATADQEDEEEVTGEEPPPGRGIHEAAAPEMDLDKGGDITQGSEDEFQRQETPPRLKARKTQPVAPTTTRTKDKVPPQPPAEQADQSTEAESESESAAAPAPAPAPAPTRPSKRPPSHPPSPSPKPQSPPEAPPKKPKIGLGVIGGKKKKEDQQPQPTPPPISPPKQPPKIEPSSHPTPLPKRPAKLGMIGGKSKTKAAGHTQPTAEADTPSPTQGRPSTISEEIPEPSPKKETTSTKRPTAPPSPPPPKKAPETEKEKADRRREELKRQLEAKGNAPTKKKRRF